MKKSFFKLGLFFLGLFLLTIPSCKPDNNDVVDQRDKFIGTWNCAETSSQNPNVINFSVTVAKDELTENEILLDNFYHLGVDQKSRLLVDYSNLSMPQQTICNLNVNGSGAFTNSKVNLIYYVNDGADIDTVNALLSK